MGALGAAVRDTVNLGKHAIAEALERKRMEAPEHLPVSFWDHAWHSVDSFVVATGRGCCGPAQFPNFGVRLILTGGAWRCLSMIISVAFTAVNPDAAAGSKRIRHQRVGGRGVGAFLSVYFSFCSSTTMTSIGVSPTLMS
jgi:hypothetical protein